MKETNADMSLVITAGLVLNLDEFEIWLARKIVKTNSWLRGVDAFTTIKGGDTMIKEELLTIGLIIMVSVVDMSLSRKLIVPCPLEIESRLMAVRDVIKNVTSLSRTVTVKEGNNGRGETDTNGDVTFTA